MHRRQFLRATVPGLTLTAAGCLGGASENQPTSSETTSKLTTPQSPVTVLNSKLRHEGEGEETQVFVRVTVENTSSRKLGQVVATATFVEENVLLDSWVATANGIAAGQEWLVSIRSGGTTGEDATAVDDVQVTVEERTPPADLDSPRIEIVEDELVHNNGEVRVDGVAENVGDERLEYATTVATFTGEDDVLLGKALTDTTRDVDSGQQFRFSIRYNSPVRAADAVAGYQLTTDADVES